jgi:hypothetical protein
MVKRKSPTFEAVRLDGSAKQLSQVLDKFHLQIVSLLGAAEGWEQGVLSVEGRALRVPIKPEMWIINDTALGFPISITADGFEKFFEVVNE